MKERAFSTVGEILVFGVGSKPSHKKDIYFIFIFIYSP